MKKVFMIFFSILMIGVLAACTNGNQQDQDHTQNKETTPEPKQKAQDLKQYSQDPDKDKDQDFDLIGTFVKEDTDQLTLKIQGKEINIPKSKMFSVKGTQKDLKDQLVKVEVGSKIQQAEEMELTAIARANNDGVYEQDGDETKIIGTFVSETDQELTIKVKNGNKTYKKTTDFEKDIKNAPADLKGKTVRIELQKDGKIESLDYEPEDQDLE